MRLCAFIVHALNSMCISQATANDRAAGNGRLADALRIVDEDKESALAEAASRAATELAAAIAVTTVRAQATDEQEEATDALRVESEALLNRRSRAPYDDQAARRA